MSKNHSIMVAVKEKVEEFSFKIQNKFSDLHNKAEGDAEKANDKLSRTVMETALEERKAPENSVSKLTHQHRQNLEIHKFNMDKTKETLKNDRSMKATNGRLGTGRLQLFALKDANGNVTNNIERGVRTAEQIYTDLYSNQGWR